MTRTIELCAQFETERGVTSIRFDDTGLWLKLPGANYKLIPFDDFDKIAAELANFRKLNDSVKDAA
jgi:hypothetical protein